MCKIRRPPRPTPTPIPALAAVERPVLSDEDADRDGVIEGRDVSVLMVDDEVRVSVTDSASDKSVLW